MTKYVLVRIAFDVNEGHLIYDDQEDLVFFTAKYLPLMNLVEEELNRQTMAENGVEQYRIFGRG